MKLITHIPGFCEPIEYTVAIEELNDATYRFLEWLFAEYQINKKEFLANGFATVNLTHIKGLAGAERFFKWSGNKYALMEHQIEERDFTEMPDEVADTYLGTVIRTVERLHKEKFGEPFVGRYQLIWVNPNACYPLHIDKHTPHRYHIPLKTNIRALWVFRNGEEFDLMHMPADGRVWYLDPIQREHSVANLGLTPRCHLLMTSGA